MEDDCLTVHLCHTCLHSQDCYEAHTRYPILDCGEFEPEDAEPDGDAYWEYMNASLYGHEPVGHGD